MRDEKKKLFGFTGWDIALAAVFLAAAALIWALLLRPDAAGSSVEITRGGELVGVYDLSVDRVLTFSDGGHENTVLISGGEVRVTEANCPDQYCVKHSAIRYRGECIVCLPARLVVTITGGEEAPIDAFSG